MIDWLNPSLDVIEAKQVGYNEGCESSEGAIEDLENEIDDFRENVKSLKKENAELHAVVSAIASSFEPGMDDSLCCDERQAVRRARNAINDLREGKP